MGSHQKLPPLLAPLAMAVAAINNDTKPKDSWYSIKALSKGRAEILLYDEIGGWGISAQQFARDLKALGDLSQIDLRIHSPGGDVFEGMAIYNLLRSHPANVDGYVDGLAASMGSVVLMAANTIHIPANAMIMVHKPWGIQGGDADDMRRYAELLDKVESSLVMAYVSKTGKSEEEIKALLKQETWMTGREAVEAGFADQLTEPLVAAAQLTSHRMQEFDHMPPAMQNLMSPRAHGTTPPAAPVPAAPAPAAPAATAPAPAAPDTAAVRAQLIAEENTRRAAISAVFQPFAAAHGDLLQACLADMNISAEQAQTQLLAKLGGGSTPTATPAATHIHAGNGNLVGDSVRAAILARTGMAAIEASNNYNWMSLRELARASLQDRGIGVAAYNPMQMVGMAFTHSSSDFGSILLDVANKSVLQGWEESEETFEQWVKEGQLSDFKIAHRVGLGEFPSLREVRPGAEYKHITVGDRGESIVLATYGELFGINRQAIINDDLSQLTDIPRKMGMAAKATIGDIVYAKLVANGAMSDGVALFHKATHKNLLDTATSALSIEAMSAARQLMRTQKTQVEGGKARTLNIRPAFLLAPIALEDKARQLITSTSVPGADINAGIANPLKDFVQVIGEPRLDDASAKAWYLAAAKGADTIEVAYLNGVKVPYIEQQDGFTVDGVLTKVRIDAGVAALDHRGMVKAAGE